VCVSAFVNSLQTSAGARPCVNICSPSSEAHFIACRLPSNKACGNSCSKQSLRASCLLWLPKCASFVHVRCMSCMFAACSLHVIVCACISSFVHVMVRACMSSLVHVHCMSCMFVACHILCMYVIASACSLHVRCMFVACHILCMYVLASACLLHAMHVRCMSSFVHVCPC